VESLHGLGVAITGGAGDIGAAIGAELSRLGASVTLIDVKTLKEAEPWPEGAQGAEGSVRYARADVSDPDALEGVGPVFSSISPAKQLFSNGAEGIRTPDLRRANAIRRVR
jgi:NAD(P)-dependent dehydrogenase (short-subunit alcohol dehydrogenase family)